MQVLIFDPEMCCTTGVCGPAPDPALIEAGNTVERLRAAGVDVQRFQPSRHPQTFVAHPQVHQLIMDRGVAALPAVLVDGCIIASGFYPTYEQILAAQPAEPPSRTGGCCTGSSCC